MPLAVNEQSDEVKALAKEWPILEALMAGTPAMREGGKDFLPQWPAEEEASYNARLATATLFPAYRRTVSVMSGKPFAKPVTLSDDTPASIVKWSEDIDQQGVSLNVFASEMFEEVVGYGYGGILADYPATVPVKNGRTVAQVEASGARPYLVRVMHNQILGWRATSVDGRMKLMQLRLAESVEEDDGDYGVKSIAQVRVLYPGGWETWRQIGEGKRTSWQKYAAGRTTLNYIPFVPLYGERAAFMVGRPKLRDLAYLNVKHWQSQSDQDTILHVARVPILARIGAEDTTAPMVVGAGTATDLPPGADMKFVEHTGAAIGAGKDALADLQEQMIETGAELLVQRPGQRTATETANDAEGNKSDLQRMAEGFEDALDQALQFMADFARLGSGGNVSLFKDYGAATLSDASAQLVADLNGRGLLTKETTLREMQRRGVIAAEIDVEDEIQRADLEGPALGTMGVDANGNPVDQFGNPADPNAPPA